jgi:hypothetical protein
LLSIIKDPPANSVSYPILSEIEKRKIVGKDFSKKQFYKYSSNSYL